MHIGILNASHYNEPRPNWGGTLGDVYERFLRAGGGDSFEYSCYNLAFDDFPPSVEACDAYVITGSASGAYETDLWIAQLIRFIQAGFAAGKKFVGICFGHQILAQALGGYVEKSEKGFGFGSRMFEISAEKPYMTDHKPNARLYFVHQDQVMKLPTNAQLLASDDFCPNLMYAIPATDKEGDQVLGIQAHPEFDVAIMTDIEQQIGDRLPEHLAETHEGILPPVDDGAIFGRWVINFLQA